MLIRAGNLVAGYGGEPVINGIDVAIDGGQIGVIVGPNGAGKSTVLKSIYGLIKPSEGQVEMNGVDITYVPPDRRVALGMGYVPQERNIFPSLTVRENLEMGAFIRKDDFSLAIDDMFRLFPTLKTRADKLAGQLSGGQRQMVAIARALMVNPRLLLLDEPTVGLAPAVVDEIIDRIKAIAAFGVGVLIVEQNAKRALSIADIGFVLVSGKNLFTDSGRNLLNDPQVAKSFLGGSSE